MDKLPLTVEPVSRIFGLDRGKVIDRYYIELFLQRHCLDIKGRVLEIADSKYTTKFGGDRVTKSDILFPRQGISKATIIGNLETGEGLPSNAFDTVILTQTLNVIYNVNAAIGNVFKSLKTGGVLLATVPGISQISRYDMDQWGDYWRFTDLSLRRLLEEFVDPSSILVETFGNVCAASTFLYGYSADELTPQQLDHNDIDFQLLLGVRGVK